MEQWHPDDGVYSGVEGSRVLTFTRALEVGMKI